MSSEVINALDDYLDRLIVIKLQNKKTVQGNLQSFDHMMNIVLTDSKDIIGDDAKNPNKVLLRGDNIILVLLPDIPNQKDE